MKNLSHHFFNETDRGKISSTVCDVEKTTSGEIVPMVVSASYHYPMANVIGAFCIAFPLALFLTIEICGRLWLGTQNMWIFIAVFFILFSVFHALIAHVVWLKRLFLTRREIEEEVHKAAVTAFYREGLYRTEHETGVLIFISILERKVWVLADRGINEKVDQTQWKTIVDHISTGIKGKRHTDALCEAIIMVGEILKTHFPIRSDDKDELTNLIVGD